MDGRKRAPVGENGARGYRAPRSSDVAEVAKRPKKRPGRRERSSITIGAMNLPAMVKSGTISNF
jgi:hypothetical protein